VPTYEYQCEKCQRVFEVRQRITEPALTTCEACGGRVKRLLSPAPFILKGQGWYVTDYPSEARKKAKEAEKSTSNGSTDKADKPAADKPAADKPAADKPAASSASGTTGAAAPSAPAKTD
jgi:putative FmdB family regulatory protein